MVGVELKGWCWVEKGQQIYSVLCTMPSVNAEIVLFLAIFSPPEAR